jgi:hypothetical protein
MTVLITVHKNSGLLKLQGLGLMCMTVWTGCWPHGSSIRTNRTSVVWSCHSKRRLKDAKKEGSFATSTRWLNHHTFHNLEMNGEAAAADYIAAEEFPVLFKALTVEGGYTMK